jgi:hypothetical protein
MSLLLFLPSRGNTLSSEFCELGSAQIARSILEYICRLLQARGAKLFVPVAMFGSPAGNGGRVQTHISEEPLLASF